MNQQLSTWDNPAEQRLLCCNYHSSIWNIENYSHVGAHIYSTHFSRILYHPCHDPALVNCFVCCSWRPSLRMELWAVKNRTCVFHAKSGDASVCEIGQQKSGLGSQCATLQKGSQICIKCGYEKQLCKLSIHTASSQWWTVLKGQDKGPGQGMWD